MSAPKLQQMTTDPEDDSFTRSDFPKLVGGGFSFELDKEFNRCCQVRCCCFQGGCHEDLELKVQFFCLQAGKVGPVPYFKTDFEFNDFLQVRCCCMQEGCHKPCLKPEFQYFCLKCSF